MFSAWLNTHFIYEEGEKRRVPVRSNSTPNTCTHSTCTPNTCTPNTCTPNVCSASLLLCGPRDAVLPPAGELAPCDSNFNRSLTHASAGTLSPSSLDKLGPSGGQRALPAPLQYSRLGETTNGAEGVLGGGGGGGYSEEVTLILTADDLDINKGKKHKLTPDFKVELVWTVSKQQPCGRPMTSTNHQHPPSIGRPVSTTDSSTPSSVTPGDSEDEEDEESEEDEDHENSDWDSVSARCEGRLARAGIYDVACDMRAPALSPRKAPPNWDRDKDSCPIWGRARDHKQGLPVSHRQQQFHSSHMHEASHGQRLSYKTTAKEYDREKHLTERTHYAIDQYAGEWQQNYPAQQNVRHEKFDQRPFRSSPKLDKKMSAFNDVADELFDDSTRDLASLPVSPDDNRSDITSTISSLAQTDPYNLDELDLTSSNLLLDSGPNSLGDFDSIPVVSSPVSTLPHSYHDVRTQSSLCSEGNNTCTVEYSGVSATQPVCEDNGSTACTLHVPSGVDVWNDHAIQDSDTTHSVTEVADNPTAVDLCEVNFEPCLTENSMDFLTCSQSYPPPHTQQGFIQQYLQQKQQKQQQPSAYDNQNKTTRILSQKLDKLQQSRRVHPRSHGNLHSVPPSENLARESSYNARPDVTKRSHFDNKPPLIPANLSAVFSQKGLEGRESIGYRARGYSNPGKKPSKERRIRSFSQTRESHPKISVHVNSEHSSSFISPSAGTIFADPSFTSDVPIVRDGGMGSLVTHITIGDPPMNRSNRSSVPIDPAQDENFFGKMQPRETLENLPSTANGNSKNSQHRKRSNSNRFYV
ncbi:uncharacterized protein LOC125178485 [Hyalella azteca]|uniref:Uncharacterized protein LOC125178485 n=1 Tax=Hyalella azteca TaxID=294128 RepID=A0A979FNF0_HYAAZ|nr:uncharacterized protein LOC125178485 [Hyalella azteca]